MQLFAKYDVVKKVDMSSIYSQMSARRTGRNDRFVAHLEPNSIPVFSRYKFYNHVQSEKETLTVEQFLTDLKLLVRDEVSTEMIVFSTNSYKIREKLVNEAKYMTLDKTVIVKINRVE